MTETKDRVREGLEAIQAQIKGLSTDAQWRHWMEVAAARDALSFGRLSFGNILWLLAQAQQRGMNGVSRVATYATWSRLGRQVRKGEKALHVLRPNTHKVTKTIEREGTTVEETRSWLSFSTLTEFDISQTDGPALPVVTRSLNLNGAEWDRAVETLKSIALALPEGFVRGITFRAPLAWEPQSAQGWFCIATKQIVVVPADKATMFAVLVHEIAHAILHGANDHHSTPVREVEAESVAFIVCRGIGLDTSAMSLPYVAAWGAGEKSVEQIQKSGERIVNAAHKILDALLPVTS